MAEDSAYFIDRLYKFNEQFSYRFRSAARRGDNLWHEIGLEHLLVHSTFLGEEGFSTPHPNQIVASLVYGPGRTDAIQIQRGALVVATAVLHGGEVCAGSVPVFELTLNTSLLSDFNAYPLHAFTNEPESFFCNRGYGRLSLCFAILHALCLGADVTVRCDTVVTSYRMFLLVRPADPSSASADAETEPPAFLRTLLARENKPPRMRDFQEFAAWHRAEVPTGEAVVYRVRATLPNKERVARAIQQWSADKLTSATDTEFMARFLHGPTRADYNASPALQQSHPELTYAHRVSRPRTAAAVRGQGSPRYI